MFDLEGQMALVTGGSRGIGATIAEGLLSAGVKVLICALDANDPETSTQHLGLFGDCSAVEADLGDRAGIKRVVECGG